ncbi:MAG TPA: class I SAM-dependent methyltransferase [Candidatus Limnocylindrales bacterium]|nr:class I SAM-dependent methyltransferase [Candidatus Limnocylindrales bacterium]
MTDPAAFYAADSLHVEVYDELGAATVDRSSPANDDLAFFRRVAAETGGPILEIGCGTGRVTLQLAADGYEVVGMDLSAPMLRVAEQRRRALPEADAACVTFVEADLATLDLGRRFALIVAPARVFQFMLTTAAQRQALAALRRHLTDDGRLVLDLFDPMLDYVVPGEGMPRTMQLTHPMTGNRVTVAVTARWPDPGKQLIVEEWTFQELDAAGEAIRTAQERLTLRWSLRAEMRLLFELEGLEVEGDYGDFGGGPPAYGQEQVWVLKRASRRESAS